MATQWRNNGCLTELWQCLGALQKGKCNHCKQYVCAKCCRWHHPCRADKEPPAVAQKLNKKAKPAKAHDSISKVVFPDDQLEQKHDVRNDVDKNMNSDTVKVTGKSHGESIDTGKGVRGSMDKAKGKGHSEATGKGQHDGKPKCTGKGDGKFTVKDKGDGQSTGKGKSDGQPTGKGKGEGGEATSKGKGKGGEATGKGEGDGKPTDKGKDNGKGNGKGKGKDKGKPKGEGDWAQATASFGWAMAKARARTNGKPWVGYFPGDGSSRSWYGGEWQGAWQ